MNEIFLTKVISGGQTGIDQAGLHAASYFWLETGGWIPKGFKTQDGNCPELGVKYNLKEHSSDKYPPRTELNVTQSDGTIRIASDFQSAGELTTLRFIKKYNKPYFDVKVNNLKYIDDKPPISEFCDWLFSNKIKTLNVAGNSEKTAPGIGMWGTLFLMDAFNSLGIEVKNGA